MSDYSPGLVAVEGPIGVGKTSLAKRLAESLKSDLLLEHAEENPFLERFYQDPKGAALPTQLHFLFQRSRQLETLRQGDLFRTALVADYLPHKDRLFAQLNLDADEFHLYEEVAARLDLSGMQPDLVIYLQAPTDVLQRRVAKRGRGMENRMDGQYLQRLSEAYTEFFYYFNEAPLLIVNAADINLVSNEADYNNLLSQVRTIRSGRHYFNPLPVDL
jgi:deoxyadenosine/deoxycytidine kinase